MKKWLEEIHFLLKNKCYIIVLSLTALCSYGFMITHHTIGIDDTPYGYYFEDGLAAIVGRWVLFLCNKVIDIADFAPFLTDFAGVILLILGVSVWCVILKRIFQDRIPFYGYLFFSCLFLSNSLISEVYTYYLHNGIGIGYLACGVSLCFFCEFLERKRMPLFLGSILCLWIAMGCYESFMIVYLVAVCIVLTARCLGKEKTKVGKALLIAFGIAFFAMVLRSIMIQGVCFLFGLEDLKGAAVQRSITELMEWLLKEGAMSEFFMVIKRVFVMYTVFAYAYYPIKIYMLAVIILILIGLYRSIKDRNPRIILLIIGGILASYFLVFVEGKATLYRSAQFLPLFSAWGLFTLFLLPSEFALPHNVKKISSAILITVMSVIVWNQCADMNAWFYVDYLKYEDAKNTMNQIAYELEKSYDTEKPIIFTGIYKVPESITQRAYVAYNSEIYYKMLRITTKIDSTLLEKYYRDQGVWVAQTPALSILDWGRYAFHTNEELIRFFAMHGHILKPQMDISICTFAEEYSLELPSFPETGSIVDMGEYIIVHF
ncbi:glucosyltransferase domain-containing protein [Lachnospiraceae bacterium OttesenSCG-928-D06]|nr:glucosyltransferase domain-containing protein [Lachnospiraceae bacterium OttesenSCG-928-D06]